MKINPAILVTDRKEYQKQIELATGYTDEVDVDIIDWERHSLKTIGVDNALNVNTPLKLNFDLMLDYPTRALERLISDQKVQRIIVNLESKESMGDIINFIQSKGIRAGISLNPENTLSQIEDLLAVLDLVQIFTVEPGAQGNPFLPQRLKLAKELRGLGFTGQIEVDGGINLETVDEVLKFPVDILSVGSALSKAKDPGHVFTELLDKSAQKRISS